MHFQALVDYWKLRGYTPPPNVLALAEKDTLTDSAKHIFYVNHPDLSSDVTTFRKDCSFSEQTIVLGCYHSNQAGIAIYDVQDVRLHGVQEVTAAHEMLHAAWDRLSAKDKSDLSNQLTNYYNNDVHDQRLIDIINAYKKTEPNDVVDEMHSIFGTEVPNLPSSLETYYQRYFTSRSAVVQFAQGYEGEFTSRLNQINAYDAQLASLKQQISDEEQSLSAQVDKINADRSRLDSLRNSNQIGAYNAGVANFNAEVDAYNAKVARLRADIARYNQTVDARNAIASDLRSLDQAIDTRLTTQAAQ
jgi:DNA repair exonuclease SbcCD ATPase subunit